MKKAKKNNKGFSLVELIVVVLIMAIIAVALAPQVMKWVERSREAKDVSNYDSLVSAAQLALVKGLPSAEITVTVSGTDTKVTAPAAGDATFEAGMDAALPGWKSIKLVSKKYKTGGLEIKIGTNGGITRDSDIAEVSAD